MRPAKFFMLYTGFTFLTYFWRLAFIAIAFEPTTEVDVINIATQCLMIFTYLALIYIAYLRGKHINKTYLIALPIIAGLFDLMITTVLFVPTAMNITALCIGLYHKGVTRASKPASSKTS